MSWRRRSGAPGYRLRRKVRDDAVAVCDRVGNVGAVELRQAWLGAAYDPKPPVATDRKRPIAATSHLIVLPKLKFVMQSLGGVCETKATHATYLSGQGVCSSQATTGSASLAPVMGFRTKRMLCAYSSIDCTRNRIELFT